ncbi:MAG TPA: protein kinase, partial [Thermoanaerobaculia bacterium]|nr:protein kinase [Thermoanaerobaculia bacterium]
DGTAVGTAGYMAPEQIRGDAIDARTDVWSLGVVLYEMVTGRSPFPAETDHERIRGILSRDPEPVAALRKDVPPSVDRIVVRALAKRAEDRYPRMEELRNDLLRAAENLGMPGFQDGFDPTIREIPSSFSRPRANTEETGHGLSGQIVAHYRVGDLLGGGGMGVVYKAEDLRLNRTVALKFLPPELTRDPEAKARFLQEARSASVLDHPNICTIHEVGETDDGRLYLAMPSYDGETLRKRIEAGPLAIDEATDIAQQIARGLSKAHRHGIIHRDIKPANLIVTSDGVVKILDFGLAKLAGSAALTRTGSSVGTPAYMSPEQARGEEVDHRADLWSLGIVLYEMVAGRRPFRGEHEQAVLFSLLNERPRPLHELRSEAPPELERIVDGLLAKDPGDRYPTVDGPLGDLTALRNESMTTTVRTHPGDAQPAGTPVWMWPAALAVVAALIAGGLWLWARGGRYVAGPAPEASFNRLTDLEGSESFPSLSPDGKNLVYVKAHDGNRDIYFQPVAGGNTIDLTADSPADDTQPAFSPDGSQIAFRSEREGGGLFVMGTTGGAVRRLTGAGFNPSWSPDGTKIAFASESVSGGPLQRQTVSQLWLVDVATRKMRPVGKDDGVQPSWSPHGKRIAYWGVPAGTSQRILYTIPAEGGLPVQAVRDGYVNWNPVWSADGRYLYYVSNRSGSMNVWQLPIDETTGEPQGVPEPVTPSSQSVGLLSLAGRQIAYATDEGKSNLERWAFDPSTFRLGDKPQAVTQGSRSVRSVAVSPDGRWIAFDTSAPQENLYLVKPDGTGQRQLTTDGAKDRVPQWLPGGRLLFYSDRGHSYGLWTIGVDGLGLQPIPRPGTELTNPIPSPDGQEVVASLGAKGATLLDLSGGAPRKLPRPAGDREVFAAHAWSPDGKFLAGTLEQGEGSAVPGIVLYSFDQSRYERLTDAGSQPIWLHDGKTLLYLHDGKIYRVSLKDRTPRLVLAPPPNSSFKSLAVSPDDRSLYAVRPTDEGDIWMLTLKSAPGSSDR